MTTYLKYLLIAALAISLGGCSYLEKVFGQSTGDAFVNDSLAAMKGYKAYQIGLAAYGQTHSGDHLYKVLYDLDTKVTACVPAAESSLESPTPDMALVNACLFNLNVSQVNIQAAGIKPVVLTGVPVQ